MTKVMILLKNVLYARIATEVLTHSIALQKKGDRKMRAKWLMINKNQGQNILPQSQQKSCSFMYI